jgi:hypothetical protein
MRQGRRVADNDRMGAALQIRALSFVRIFVGKVMLLYCHHDSFMFSKQQQLRKQ